ncbi:hypothetical protein [Clostridium sp. WB02_MRS01]|uniref:hypothetical protein n=2 Tax=Eubacteriales TaxID=186802 RepID=UPI00336C2136
MTGTLRLSNRIERYNMAYERIEKPEGSLYHYTKKERLDSILQDGRIRRFGDRECWFCTSLEDTLTLMERTVMQEGKPYYDVNGILQRYPTFVPEDYVILRLTHRYQNGEWVRWNQEISHGSPPELLAAAKEFSRLKVGFRSDFKFQANPEVIEVAPLLEQNQQPRLSM